MRYLREISQIVTRYREKNIDLIEADPSPDTEDNVTKLYLALKEGKITTDIAAAEYIYGSPQVDTRYTTLKNRLKRKLINLLFFLEVREKDFSEQLVARYNNSKSLFWANTLSIFGARVSATKLYESTLRQALHYDFTANAIQCVVLLRNYSRFRGSEHQYDKYDKLIKKLLRTYDVELRAQEYFERITIRFSRSVAEQPDLEETCRTYLTELEGYKNEVESFNFYLYYYRLKALTLQVAQKYSETVGVCDEAMKYFDEHRHIAYRLLYAEFYLQKLTCFLHLREYKKGKEAVEISAPFYPEGGANWFIFMEYRFLLEMHTYHFKEAEELYTQTINSPRFQFLAEETKEKWFLYGMYLDFALRRSDVSHASDVRKAIDTERFLRNVPTFKKDKRGYNIAILILQVILLLEQNDFGSIIDRMDALRTYRNRYLQVGTNRRSALFFKMLQIMEANSFDPKATATKSKQYYQRMSAQTADVVEAQDGLQIVSYEWLWETIMTMLQEKQKQGRI